MNRWTELLAFDPCPDDPHASNSTPIYQTATFAQPSATASGTFDYSRSGNPTRRVLEERLACLEDCRYAFAFASGMAALSTVTRLVEAGDHVIAGSDLYGGSHRLLTRVLQRCNVDVSFVDSTDLDAVRDAFRPRTRLLLSETPSNPLQRVTDLAALAQLTHEHEALLAVDNSLASPWLQQPLALGADLAVHSATKHLAGHGDLSAGLIAVRDEGLAQTISFLQNAEGSALSPFDSWLLLRGLQTLPLRIERQQNTAIRIAEFLAAHGKVSAVHFPGLSDHPGHELHARQARGPGALISFQTGDVVLSERLVEATRLFTISVSFGSLHSLISLPCRMSHASIPSSERQLPEDLVRLSIGIEDPDDLIDDLSEAIQHALRGSQPQRLSRTA